MTRVFIADTETTGTDPAVDQVVELAMMELPDTPALFLKAQLEDLEMTHKLYSHTAPMKLGALAAHGITPDMLDGKPVFDREKDPGLGGYMIGHNVDFDAEFMDNQGCKRICTLAIARAMWPEIDSHTQGAVLHHVARLANKGDAWARDLNKGAHRADADVMNCARILKFMIFVIARDHELKGGISWEDIYQYSLDCKVPKVMSFGKFKGMPIADVEQSWAEWYAGTDTADKWVLMALQRAGKLA